MTLRRTALTRKSELRRSKPMPRHQREGKDRVVRAAQRPKDTGPSPRVRAAVLARAGGCCEVCRARLHHEDTGWVAAHSVHHRRPRGAGGSSRADTNTPANLLLLCGSATTAGCHQWVESNRTRALDLGLLLTQGQHPAEVPVHLDPDGPPVMLTVDGTYQEAA